MYTMTDARNQQEVTVSLMDASESNESRPAFLLRMLAIFSCCCGDNKSVTVPRIAGNFKYEIGEFIPGVRRFYNNIHGKELSADREERYRQLFSAWNTFLRQVQGIQGTSAIISLDIKQDINNFIPWLRELEGARWTEDKKRWINRWLARWNTFLQARAGETLVTSWNFHLTIVGYIFYIVDQVSDIGTFIYYASSGQWWQAMVTLTLVYGAVIFYTAVKGRLGQIHCTSSADYLRYVGSSLLVNWPDVKQYGGLCLLEREMCKSPANSAHLVPEWHQRRVNAARLKFTEGVWEACPQAILQLCLLVPDLYGDWTWTNYLRIAATFVSLCTAGAALVNMEKYERINDNNDLPLSELVVLHVWAVPVTVSRLLSVALILSVHPYWALAGLALHLVLRCVHMCRTKGVPSTVVDVIYMCLNTLLFLISPFAVAGSITYRRVYHAIHFLVNTVVMVVWALGTPLVCTHPALFIVIICFSAIIFAVGLLGWQLHEKKWPDSYLDYV